MADKMILQAPHPERPFLRGVFGRYRRLTGSREEAVPGMYLPGDLEPNVPASDLKAEPLPGQPLRHRRTPRMRSVSRSRQAHPRIPIPDRERAVRRQPRPDR